MGAEVGYTLQQKTSSSISSHLVYLFIPIVINIPRGVHHQQTTTSTWASEPRTTRRRRRKYDIGDPQNRRKQNTYAHDQKSVQRVREWEWFEGVSFVVEI